VFVGPGLPGGSGTVGLGLGVTVGVAVAFGVGVGFGFTVGFASEDDADVAAGAVDEPGPTEPGVLETDDEVPNSEEAGADVLTGGSDRVASTLLAGSRSIAAATMRPPSSTSTSVPTTTRSRTEPGIGIAVRSP
jgi:hypothetical protein